MSRQESRDRYKKQVESIEKRTLENEKMLIQSKLNYNKEKKRIEYLENMVRKHHHENLLTKTYT